MVFVGKEGRHKSQFHQYDLNKNNL